MNCTECIANILRKTTLLERKLQLGRSEERDFDIVEGILKEVKCFSAAGANVKLHDLAEDMHKIIIKGRKAKTDRGKQQLSQSLRACRKQASDVKLDKLNAAKIVKATVASRKAFNAKKPGTEMRKLLHPLFNVEEVRKQLNLLLDHMADRSLRCRNCIEKHITTIEALLEEAIGLDDNTKHIPKITKMLNLALDAHILYAKKGRDSYANMYEMLEEIMTMCVAMLKTLPVTERVEILEYSKVEPTKPVVVKKKVVRPKAKPVRKAVVKRTLKK